MKRLLADNLATHQRVDVQVGKLPQELRTQAFCVIFHQQAVFVERFRAAFYGRLRAQHAQDVGHRRMIKACKKHLIRMCADVVQKSGL